MIESYLVSLIIIILCSEFLLEYVKNTNAFIIPISAVMFIPIFNSIVACSMLVAVIVILIGKRKL